MMGLVNFLLKLFRIAHNPAENPENPFARLGQAEKERLFLKSVKHYMAKRYRLLLQPFGNVITLLYDAEELNKAIKKRQKVYI